MAAVALGRVLFYKVERFVGGIHAHCAPQAQIGLGKQPSLVGQLIFVGSHERLKLGHIGPAAHPQTLPALCGGQIGAVALELVAHLLHHRLAVRHIVERPDYLKRHKIAFGRRRMLAPQLGHAGGFQIVDVDQSVKHRQRHANAETGGEGLAVVVGVRLGVNIAAEAYVAV